MSVWKLLSCLICVSISNKQTKNRETNAKMNTHKQTKKHVFATYPMWVCITYIIMYILGCDVNRIEKEEKASHYEKTSKNTVEKVENVCDILINEQTKWIIPSTSFVRASLTAVLCRLYDTNKRELFTCRMKRMPKEKPFIVYSLFSFATR